MFIALQYILPKHLLSRLGGRLANAKTPWIKNTLIRAALKHYRINMTAAEVVDPFSYESFNAFFTRKLAQAPASYFPSAPQWGSPAEGVLSQAGHTDSGTLIQAKGKKYTVEALLAHHPWSTFLQKGSFATIYLAPHNYHRVHSPISGTITEIRFIPGQLFSVNLSTASHINQLFAKNERMIFYIESAQGKLAFVMVGALMVAGIKTPFQQGSGLSIPIQMGDELGYFDFGSTVVLVSEKALHFTLPQDNSIQLGTVFASS